MAEEKQEDLSMEDILSSIKDILDKDAEGQNFQEQNKQEPSASQTEVIAAAVPVEQVQNEEPEEDVYDLSKAMIIDDGDPLLSSLDEVSSDAEDIDLNLDDVDTDLSSIDVEPIKEEVYPHSEEEQIPELQTPEKMPEEFISADNLIASEEADNIVQNVSDDVVLPEENLVEENPQEEIVDTNVEEEKTETMMLSQPEEQEAANLPADKNEISANIDEILDSASKIIYADTQNAEPQEIVSEEENLVEDKNSEQQEDDAADVSANIINNFAKMFAEKKEETKVIPLSSPQTDIREIKTLGDGSKTIENVVENVIREIIEATVNTELTANVDIANYAKEAIEKQTKEWLAANLPAVVENAVQKEIERVMAKVGK